MSTFDLHLEIHMNKNITGLKSVLAGIHLLNMNIGGAGTTIVMIYAGLSGSGILDIVLNGTTSGFGSTIMALLLTLPMNLLKVQK
ncbi:MAG: hypothetical protein ACXWFC_05345 [Nitrososphaeraceae archaeon]